MDLVLAALSAADVSVRRWTVNRWAAREVVTYAKELSAGARLLYLTLDEYARDSGLCWPSQRTLGEKLGVSVREVQNRLTELVATGFCKPERKRSGGPNQYRLFHKFESIPQYRDEQTFATTRTGVRDPHEQLVVSLIRKKQDNESELPGDPSGLWKTQNPETCQLCQGRGVRLVVVRGAGTQTRCVECAGTGQRRKRA